MKLIEILEEVARRRHSKNNPDREIQVSNILAKMVIEELNQVSGKPNLTYDTNSNEFTINVRGAGEYVVKNRAYRDNTNDPEVEDVMIEYIQGLVKPSRDILLYDETLLGDMTESEFRDKIEKGEPIKVRSKENIHNLYAYIIRS